MRKPTQKDNLLTCVNYAYAIAQAKAAELPTLKDHIINAPYIIINAQCCPERLFQTMGEVTTKIIDELKAKEQTA